MDDFACVEVEAGARSECVLAPFGLLSEGEEFGEVLDCECARDGHEENGCIDVRVEAFDTEGNDIRGMSLPAGTSEVGESRLGDEGGKGRCWPCLRVWTSWRSDVMDCER